MERPLRTIAVPTGGPVVWRGTPAVASIVVGRKPTATGGYVGKLVGAGVDRQESR